MWISKDLVAASAGAVVLSILSRGESYGYAIIQRVRELSDGQMAWTDGMLYPVLHRLERQGLIRSRWVTSERGRKRKYYRLRERGGTALREQLRQWRLVDSTIQKAGGGIQLADGAGRQGGIVPSRRRQPVGS